MLDFFQVMDTPIFLIYSHRKNVFLGRITTQRLEIFFIWATSFIVPNLCLVLGEQYVESRVYYQFYPDLASHFVASLLEIRLHVEDIHLVVNWIVLPKYLENLDTFLSDAHSTIRIPLMDDIPQFLEHREVVPLWWFLTDLHTLEFEVHQEISYVGYLALMD